MHFDAEIILDVITMETRCGCTAQSPHIIIPGGVAAHEGSDLITARKLGHVLDAPWSYNHCCSSMDALCSWCSGAYVAFGECRTSSTCGCAFHGHFILLTPHSNIVCHSIHRMRLIIMTQLKYVCLNKDGGIFVNWYFHKSHSRISYTMKDHCIILTEPCLNLKETLFVNCKLKNFLRGLILEGHLLSTWDLRDQ